ncbi:hypothetical protein CXG81DRAFT_617, partial [Caulochytrium protostelioides]
EFRKIEFKKNPKTPGVRSNEGSYWKKLKSPQLHKEFAAVSHIHFSEAAPHDYAVTAAARVHVYPGAAGASALSLQTKRAFNRFKDTAYSGVIRHDGRLLAAGDATSLVTVYDAASKSVLRKLQGHTAPVRVVRWSPVTRPQLLTGGDDGRVCVWDITRPDTPLVAWDAVHTDHVRSAQMASLNGSLFVTGSFDRTVRLWDVRAPDTGRAAQVLACPGPVDALCYLPGEMTLAVACDTEIRLLDLVAGGRCTQKLQPHTKTVTQLLVDREGTRLLSGSLDHQLKITTLQDFRPHHTIRYPAAILAVALAPDNAALAVGMTSGVVSIRRRQEATQDRVAREAAASLAPPGSLLALTEHKRERYLWGNTRAYFDRDGRAGTRATASTAGGAGVPGDRDTDVLVDTQHARRLKTYERHLKKFEYRAALDSVLGTGQRSAVVLALLEELARRGDALQVALSGRDDVALEPIVRFIGRWLADPRFTAIATQTAQLVVSMYDSVLARSPLLRALAVKLHTRVQAELLLSSQALELAGLVAMLQSGALL